MKLIVGLGNPGEKYLGTRHNLGFMVLDEMARKLLVHSSWFIDKKLKSEILETNYQLPTTNYKLILVKPQTYVNNSGMAVRQLADYYKLPSTDLIVVYDELDLPLGKIKVRLGGASAGHHGVESIMNYLGTDQFIRVRLGIGPAIGPAEKFVLAEFSPQEKQHVKHMIKQAIKALDSQFISL